MSQADALAQRITVLHRAPGYLRLELPAELCGAAAGAALEQGLSTTAGVASVAVDRAWRRISIRYDESRLSAGQVARQLFGLLDALPLVAETTPAVEPAVDAGPATGVQDWLDKLRELLAPAGAPSGSLQARLQPVLASALTEKAIINFLNDLVAFYLIKAHWDLITKRWLQQPLAHGNAWMTTFYLVFLLVRYRKTKPAA